MKTLHDKKELSPEARERVEARSRELIAEQLVAMTLRELREWQNVTQRDLAKSLGLGQDNVSRTERRPDLMLSTLRKHVAALGGELHVVVRLPGGAAIELKGLGEEIEAS